VWFALNFEGPLVYPERFSRSALALARAYNTAMDHPKLVIVQRYGTRPEAEVAKSELESAGIQAMIQGDTAGGMREHLAWSGAGFKILVREEDVTDARDVLTPPTESGESSDAGSQTDPDSRPPLRKFT
jgi:hypothetical protein